MAEEIIGVKVQVDASDVGKSVGSLKQQLREAQNEVNTLSEKFGATSKEAINAAKRAAELKDAIGDAKALTDAFNPDAKFKALTASLSGVAGGFAAVQGAIGLFGAESEEVEKTLLKVQSAMAFSQGIQAIGESVDSFKQLGAVIQSTTAFQKINNTVTALTGTVMKTLGFAVETTSTSFKVLKGAIAATGIGLLVVAVGELVNAFQNYQSAAEKAKKAQDDLNESANKGAKVAFDTEVAFLERQKQLDIAKAKNKGASEQELFKIEQDYAKRKIKAQERFIADSKEISVEDQIQQERDLKKQQNDIKVSELNFETSQNQKKKEKKKTDAATAKQEIEKQKQIDEQAEKDKQARQDAAFEVNRKAFIATLTDKNKELLAIEDGYEQSRATLLRAGITDFAAIEEEKRLAILAVDNKYNQITFENSEKIRIDKKEKDEEEFNYLQDLQKKTLEKKQQRADEELKATVNLENAKFEAVAGGLNLLMSLAGENEKVANALFVIDKALAIARIVVDTQREIAGYAANPLWTAMPDGGLIIKSKYSLAAKIRAGVSIATIAASSIGKFKNGSAPPQTGGISGVGGAAPMQPAAPQAQLTQLNQASINQMGSATGRAYVVESDITNSQEKITRINRAARLG